MNPTITQPRTTSVEREYPAAGYACRRCGQKIPHGDNGLESRRLAIYCAECAGIIVEREEERRRRAPAVRVVRVRSGRKGWIEYRGQFPSAIFQGREIPSDKTQRL